MITVYIWDTQNIYSHSVEADPLQPMPNRSTTTSPPATTGREVAMWTSSGWVILPDRPPMPDPAPEPVPASVTRAQGKAALIQAGIWDQVKSFVESIVDPTEKAMAEVALNDTLEWKRTSPFLNAAAQALDIEDQALDDLFRAAEQIEL